MTQEDAGFFQVALDTGSMRTRVELTSMMHLTAEISHMGIVLAATSAARGRTMSTDLSGCRLCGLVLWWVAGSS